MDEKEFLKTLVKLFRQNLSRQDKAKKVADLLRVEKRYRWVGLYDVTNEKVINIAWSGPSAPAFPVFPVTQGLTSRAVSTGKTISIGNVNKDSDYLTALGSTQSEVIVPIIDPDSNRVVGTLDVESEKLNGFNNKEQQFLEKCAHALSKIWS